MSEFFTDTIRLLQGYHQKAVARKDWDKADEIAAEVDFILLAAIMRSAAALHVDPMIRECWEIREQMLSPAETDDD